jgi:hypothetical protein
MSTNLLRVHDELSKVARVHAAGDFGTPTTIPSGDIAATPAEREQVQA